MNPEKQLEKLHALMIDLNKGNATEEDVKKLFELSLKAVESLKTQLEASIESHKGEVSKSTQSLSNDLVTLHGAIQDVASTLEETEVKISSETDKTITNIYREIMRIEGLIPTVPSLLPIQQRITALESKVPEPQKEVIADEIRDKLETLEGENRLDASAIKNLPKAIEKSKAVVGSHIIGGRNIGMSGQVAYLNIPVQSSAPSSPELNMLWIQTS